MSALGRFTSKIAGMVAGTAVVAAASLAVAPAAGATVNCNCRPTQDASMVFVSNRTGSLQIFKADNNLTRITQLTSGGNHTVPSMNQARTLIAYTAMVNGHDSLFVMNADGSNQRNVTTDNFSYDVPRISPDGTQVVVTSGRNGGGSQLYVVTVATGAVRQLTFGGVTDGINWAPSWSPNGQYIAFTSSRANTNNVWLMRASGGGAQKVTYDGGDDAAWSPNGQEIAYSFIDPGTHHKDIYWADAFSVNVVHRVSTPDSFDHVAPSWAPDGSAIAFTSIEPTNVIKVATPNGANQHTLIPGQAGHGDWGFPFAAPVMAQQVSPQATQAY